MLRIRLTYFLIHCSLIVGVALLLWSLTGSFPVRARVAFMAAFVLGLIHARVKKRVASETARPWNK